MMEFICYIEPPNRPEAEDIFRLLHRGAIEAHSITGLPVRETDTDDEYLLKLWREGMILVTSARAGGDKGPPVAVMATSASKTDLGTDLMLILVRYTLPEFRQRGINDKLSDFTDDLFRKRDIQYALSIVVPNSAGHKQMEKRGVEYRQIQGVRRL